MVRTTVQGKSYTCQRVVRTTVQGKSYTCQRVVRPTVQSKCDSRNGETYSACDVKIIQVVPTVGKKIHIEEVVRPAVQNKSYT